MRAALRSKISGLRNLENGQVGEWLRLADCKSACKPTVHQSTLINRRFWANRLVSVSAHIVPETAPSKNGWDCVRKVPHSGWESATLEDVLTMYFCITLSREVSVLEALSPILCIATRAAKSSRSGSNSETNFARAKLLVET